MRHLLPKTFPFFFAFFACLWQVWQSDTASARSMAIRPLPTIPDANLGQLLVEEGGRQIALPIEELQLRVHIQGRMARTEVEQVFRSPLSRQSEGSYAFRLPDGAAIVRLAMDVEGKLMEGELVERSKARAIYRSIVRSMRDPALLEWQGGSRFETQIFPIPANGTKRIILTYEHVLPSTPQAVDYLYHLPRPDSHLTIQHFTLRAEIEGKRKIQLMQPYTLEKSEEGQKTILTLAKQRFRPQGALLLRLAHSSPASELVVGQHQGASYGVLDIPIRLQGTRTLQTRQLLLLDTSASQQEKGLQHIQALAKAWIEAMPPTSPLGLVAGDFTIRPFKTELVEVAACKKDALAFLNAQKPRGATRLLAMFLRSVEIAQKDAEVIYFGDGQASLGEMDASLIAAAIEKAAKPKGVRVSALATGEAPDMALLEKIAKATGGRVFKYLPTQAPASAVEFLLSLMREPQLHQISYQIKGMQEIARQGEGSLASGQSLLLAGKLDKKAVHIEINGVDEQGKAWQHKEVVEPSDSRQRSLAPTFWARWTLDQLEKTAQDRPKIVQLSKDFRVMSRYTSFLVLENEQAYQRYQIARRSEENRRKALQQRAATETAVPTGGSKGNKDRAAAIRSWMGASAQKQSAAAAESERDGAPTTAIPRAEPAPAPTQAAPLDAAPRKSQKRKPRAMALKRPPSSAYHSASSPKPPASPSIADRDDATVAPMKPAPKPVEQPLKNKPKKPEAPAPFSLLLDTKGTVVRWMPLDNGKRGLFWLKSRPSEADVYIDGHRVGKTPLRVSIPLGLSPIPMRDGHPFKAPIQISIRRCGYTSFNFRLASVSRGAYLARLKADPHNPCRRGMLFKHTLPPKKQRCQADPIALSAARIKQTPLDWSERQRHLNLLEQASRWQDALTAIEEWRRYAPESIELILRHAAIYKKQGDLQESRRVLSELVEFEPHNYNRRLIYAQELKRQGNLTEACQQYGMAAYSNPSKREVFRQMMTLYRERYAQEEIRDIVHQCITHSVSRLPVVRDISLVLFWEDPRADVDLHIHEPNGEIVNYRRKESSQGGTLYYDITNGLGPEIYVLGTGKPGNYRISVVYYSGVPATLKGHLIALTDAGSPQEKRQRFDFTLHKSAGRNNIYITTLQIPQKR